MRDGVFVEPPPPLKYAVCALGLQQKIKSKVCFGRFESITLLVSSNSIVFFRVRVQNILIFARVRVEFGKNDRVQRVQVRSSASDANLRRSVLVSFAGWKLLGCNRFVQPAKKRVERTAG